jgi:phosphoglycerate kinase
MTLNILTLNDVPLYAKRVLIREDFNVAIEDGKVINDMRIRAALPGIQQALAAGAQVLLMSHLGRPEAGIYQEKFSLKPVAARLEELLQHSVSFFSKLQPIPKTCSLALYENVRFLVGETENSPALAQEMANLCDIFVMDAFGSAHRAHASTVGVAEFAPIAVAGPLLMQEVTALDRIMRHPQHPLLTIVGGAKISGKIQTLHSLITISDTLLIGGGMANTFLAAQGFNVGASLYEPDQVPRAIELLKLAQQHSCDIILPQDVVTNEGINKPVTAVTSTEQILDIGIKTSAAFAALIQDAKTILWNGPLGVFADPRYAAGTKKIAQAVAESSAYSVVGGGETITALEQFNYADAMSYISTGGGAFLEYLEGNSLPAIKVLTKKNES